MKALMRTVVAAAAVAAFVAVAQDEDDLDFGDDGAEATAESSDDGEAPEASDGESAEGGDEAAADEGAAQARPSKKAKGDGKTFFILPYCRTLEGQAEVMKPGAASWEPIQEGKFYPLGTSYRTLGKGDYARIQFGTEVEVSIRGEAAFCTRVQALDVASRSIALVSGTVTVKMPANMAPGAFEVTAPGFTCLNLAGESRYTYRTVGDGDEAVVRCVTGSMDAEGRHWSIAKMRAANELRIRTSTDALFTGLYGQSGDCNVRLDQGRVSMRDFETGEIKSEEKYLEWKLSPKTAVRIHRALPAIGERMSVTVMTFDASGELKNRCAFAENMVEVNSGELGPVLQKDSAELAKRAAEATETESGEGEADEEETEGDSGDSADGESSSEEAGGASSDDEEEIDF